MDTDEIIKEIKEYILENNPAIDADTELPLDDSLLELGIIDSFGVVELIAFVEVRWAIKILDSEITKEKFGSLRKMVQLIEEKYTG